MSFCVFTDDPNKKLLFGFMHWINISDLTENAIIMARVTTFMELSATVLAFEDMMVGRD